MNINEYLNVCIKSYIYIYIHNLLNIIYINIYYILLMNI